MNQHNLVTRTTEVPFQHIPCFYDGLSVISGPAARKILRNKTQEHDRLLPPLLAPLKSPQHDSWKELTPPSVYAPPASVLCNVGSTAGPLLRTLRTFFSALSKLTSYYKDFVSPGLSASAEAETDTQPPSSERLLGSISSKPTRNHTRPYRTPCPRHAVTNKQSCQDILKNAFLKISKSCSLNKGLQMFAATPDPI